MGIGTQKAKEVVRERPFHDPSCKPTDEALQVALGTAYTDYHKICGLAQLYTQEWGFTKGSGWSLKVHDKKKALFYLFPLYNAFKISLTIREGEREAFLGDDQLAVLHGQIASSKKYSEGFALQFDVAGEEQYTPAALLITKIQAARR